MAKRPSIKGAGADIFFSDTHDEELSAGATSGSAISAKQKAEPKVKITVRLPQSMARLLDEVYGRKKVLGEAQTKDVIVATILGPGLNKECQRLREEEKQRLLAE